MSNLEEFTELSKWLDDVTFTDEYTGAEQVHSSNVANKLVELGSRIEALEFELKEHLAMINWQSKMVLAVTSNKEQ